MLRLAKGVSQVELANLLGVKQPTVNRHERGNRSLDALAIERYARFYNVSPYELFVETEHEVEYDTAPADDADEIGEQPVQEPVLAAAT